MAENGGTELMAEGGGSDLTVAAAQAARQAQNSAETAQGHADRAETANDSAQAASATGTQAAQQAKSSADVAKGQADRAESASSNAQVAAIQASLGNEPSWIYAMVIAFLGVSLIALIVAIIIASLTGNRMINTDVISAATLILGGLIGVLAPTPGTKGSAK